MAAPAKASTLPDLRLTIIGGGFTGAVLAIHAARTATTPLDITIVEPRKELGRGVAYGTVDQAHRINVPSDRMDISATETGVASAWFRARGIFSETESDAASSKIYVPRTDYGSYIIEILTKTMSESRCHVNMRHLRTMAKAVHVTDDLWTVTTEKGETIEADRVALCFGHAVPALPCKIGPGVSSSRRFVPNPWAADAFEAIKPEDSVLIVGTGLTMADVVASLNARGHRGPMTAISRRGLLPKAHGIFLSTLDVVGESRPRTALDLIRLVRKQIAAVDPALGWHPVIDSLRDKLHGIWDDLPASEKRRAARRLLPFWEVHRFRIAPQIETELRRACMNGHLVVERTSIIGITLGDDGRLKVQMSRGQGAADVRQFDAVVLCTGPERDVSRNPLVAALLADGTARLDEIALGIAVDRRSRVLDASHRPWPGLYAFGPMTRGSFGEMTSAPAIALHIEQIVGEMLGKPNIYDS